MRDNNEQTVKIELLSQWKLEAEFRNLYLNWMGKPLQAVELTEQRVLTPGLIIWLFDHLLRCKCYMAILQAWSGSRALECLGCSPQAAPGHWTQGCPQTAGHTGHAELWKCDLKYMDGVDFRLACENVWGVRRSQICAFCISSHLILFRFILSDWAAPNKSIWSNCKTVIGWHGVHVSRSNAWGFLWQSCIAFLIECCCP